MRGAGQRQVTLPKFSPELDEDPHPKQGPGFACIQCPHKVYRPCEACGEASLRDAASKLCRPCWRARMLSRAQSQEPRDVAILVDCASILQQASLSDHGQWTSIEVTSWESKRQRLISRLRELISDIAKAA